MAVISSPWTKKPPLGAGRIIYPGLTQFLGFQELGGTPRSGVNNRDATRSGSTPPAWGSAEGGNLLFVSGSGVSTLSLGTDPFTQDLALKPFSIVARIQIVVTVGANSEISTRSDGNTVSAGWVWGIGSGNLLRLEIERSTVGNTVGVASTAMTVGKWSTVAMTTDASASTAAISHYIDGIFAGSGGGNNGGPTTTSDASQSLTIGSGNFYHGSSDIRLAWIAYFRRRLSAAEIAAWVNPWKFFPPRRVTIADVAGASGGVLPVLNSPLVMG